MNRRGHIGTVLMVFGALLLVGVALFSFYGFKDDIKSLDSEFRGLSIETWDTRQIIIHYMNTLISESIKQSKDSDNFEEDFKKKLKELTASEMNKDYFQKTTEKSIEHVRDNVFAKIVDGKFILDKFGEEDSYILSIKDLSFSLKTEKSATSIEYRFSITSKFNKEKIEYLTFG